MGKERISIRFLRAVVVVAFWAQSAESFHSKSGGRMLEQSNAPQGGKGGGSNEKDPYFLSCPLAIRAMFSCDRKSISMVAGV